MDAVSDVSRSSEIFSSVPARPPLPDPLDLDTLLGFNDVISSREQGKLSEEWKYFDRRRIFLNHVDSFTGKYLVEILTSKDLRESNLSENDQDIGFSVVKHGSKKETKVKGAEVIKGRIYLKPKGSTKSERKTSKGNKRKSKSRSPVTLRDKLPENLDNIFNEEEKQLYDTSKLTVAEYYEMMDLESNYERENFLKEKLFKFVEDINKGFTNVVSPAKKIASEEITNDYKIIGTLIFDDKIPDGVSEIVKGSKEDSSFVEQIIKCGTIIYVVNEDKEEVSEATVIFNSVLNYIDKLKERVEPNQFQVPMFILVSSFMTWAFTKPLIPEEPDLPFIEKDFRKRKPHTNYQMLYELEEQVIKAQKNGDIEAAVIVSGIPYGHEEFTFKYFFERAFQLVDLPMYNCGNNNIPVVHVENLTKIVKEVLIRKCDINAPFVFAKDPMNYSLKDIIKAISTSLGTGCYQVVPDSWAFLSDEITQYVYDQLTANIYLESCYPLFIRSDIQWKYDDGFGTDIDNVIKEYKAANNLKPLNIVVYGTYPAHTTEISSELSEIYRVYCISPDHVLQEYFATMQEQMKKMEEDIPSIVKKDLKSTDGRYSDIPSLKETGGLECVNSNNITNQLEYFKKLNIKRHSDVKMFTEAQKTSIIRNTLLAERSCLNHGYVLNEFPQTLVQARLLYQTNNILGNYCAETGGFPVYVIGLRRVEETVTQSPSEINQELVYNDYRPSQLSWCKEEPKTGTEEEGSTDETVVSGNSKTNELMDSSSLNVEGAVIAFLLEQNPQCKYIEIEVNTEITETVLRQILEFIEGGDVSDDLMNKTKIIKNIIEEKEVEVAVNDISDLKNSLTVEDSLSKLKESEEMVLAVRSYPLLKYLINYIYPTLTNAILEVCETRSDDPLDFLAEYLFRHNPDGRMPDPGESATTEDGFPNRDKVPRACHSLFLISPSNN